MTSGFAPKRLVTLSALLALGVAAGLEAGEVTIEGAIANGSYGTDTDTEARALLARYVTGDRVQFRVEVPLLDLDVASPVTPGPIAPIPRRRQGPSGSTGSNGQGESGIGPGPSPPEESPSPEEPPAPGVARVRGLGDVALGVSTRLLGGGAKIYRLNADAGVKLPTGDADENLGTGETDVRIGASGEYRFWSVTAFGGAGWTWYGDPEAGPLEDGVDGWAGLESLPLGDRLIVSGWLSGNQEVVAGAGSRVTASLGFRTAGRWRWRGSVTTGLTGPAADLLIRLGVSFGVDVPSAGRRGSWR